VLRVLKGSPTQLPTPSFPLTGFAYPVFVQIPVATENKRAVHRLDEKERQKVVCVRAYAREEGTAELGVCFTL